MLTKDDHQRQSGQSIEENELFFQNLIADSLDGILLTNEEGTIRYVSPSVKQILGYDREDIIGKNAFSYVHPEDREEGITTFKEELIQQPTVKFVSIRLLKKNGDWLWCIVRGHNMMHNPHLGCMAIYFYDDTRRKEAETALIESERKFRTQATILKNVSDVIVTVDPNRNITSWNKVMAELTGLSEPEVLGRRFREVMVSDYSPYTHDEVAEIVLQRGVWRGEVSFMGADGKKHYILHAISLLTDEKGECIGMLGIGKDITERKKIETTLQESELFYRSLIEHSLDGIAMTNANGVITYCGPSVKEISGLDPEDLLGHHFSEFVHPDELKIAYEAFNNVLNKSAEVTYTLLRVKGTDNNWVWYKVRAHNLLNNSLFNAIVFYFTDNTQRKEIEDKLISSEEQFRNLIENLSQGVVLQDKMGQVILCNNAACKMIGLTREEMMGKTNVDYYGNIVDENGRQFHRQLLPSTLALQTKQRVRNVVMGVFRPAIKDKVWLLVNADPTLDDKGEIINIIISFTDITQQRNLSRQLIENEVQKQKQLTQATIFGQEKERREIGKELHDNVNQHLNTIRLYLEVAMEKATGKVAEMINLSHKSLTNTINEIRVMSQSLVPPTLGDLGLIESVQDLCDALRRAHAFSIDFTHRYFSEDDIPGDLRLILFRIIQEQINNIIRHANASNVQIKLQSDAENIILTIVDNGNGFDISSTKKGLGFNNIFNRADLFGGRVDIDSSPGGGCKLSVVVPVPAEEDPE